MDVMKITSIVVRAAKLRKVGQEGEKPDEARGAFPKVQGDTMSIIPDSNFEERGILTVDSRTLNAHQIVMQ